MASKMQKPCRLSIAERKLRACFSCGDLDFQQAIAAHATVPFGMLAWRKGCERVYERRTHLKSKDNAVVRLATR